MSSHEWKERFEEERRQKDEFFAVHPQSPISPRERHTFRGLSYWPVDPNYRFELELREYDEPQVIAVADTKGQERKLWRWGEFRFQLDGEQVTLCAYRSDPREERFFIPFRDRTSGKESYGAGRYLDLSPQDHLAQDGKWVVDFNEAYNPWCAYSEDYACPFVPTENWLSVPVRAGEKNYPHGENAG